MEELEMKINEFKENNETKKRLWIRNELNWKY